MCSVFVLRALHLHYIELLATATHANEGEVTLAWPMGICAGVLAEVGLCTEAKGGQDLQWASTQLPRPI